MSRRNTKETEMTEKRIHLPKPKPLIECFEELPDPRMDRGKKHKLVDILVIGLCSQLTGGSGFSDMEAFGKIRKDWLRTFLNCPRASLRTTPSTDASPQSTRTPSWTVLWSGCVEYARL